MSSDACGSEVPSCGAREELPPHEPSGLQHPKLSGGGRRGGEGEEKEEEESDPNSAMHV